jgi:glycosyltransferase involved in cell wall biosynthesis
VSTPLLRVAVVARAVMPLHGVGGLERSVHDLVRHLAARGVYVTLVTPPGTATASGASDPFRSPQIAIRHVPYVTFPLANRRGTTILDRSSAYLVFGWRAGRMVRTLVGQRAVDIVHSFGASALGYAVARARAGRDRARAVDVPTRDADAPLVLNPQGLEEFGATAPSQALLKRIGYWPLRRAVRLTAAAADAILATDAALESTVVRHLRPRPGQLRTIANGIDLAAADAIAGPAEGSLLRQRHGLPPGDLVLLSVGRLEFNKGFDVLARALARLARPGGPLASVGWRWVLVGDGPFRHEIEATVQSSGLGRQVILAGRVPEAELHAWYEAATIFVHPTRYEGSSLVTLEALAHRKAVVATEAGGLPDKVRPGVNGWLVEPGNVEELARAIGEATTNPAALAAIGAKSREIVEREFAWTVLVERHIELYAELLSVSRQRAEGRGRREVKG